MTHSARVAACVAAMHVLGCGGGDGGDTGVPSSCPADGLEVPDVSGEYLVNDLRLISSDCSSDILDEIDDAIGAIENCVFSIAQDGARVSAIDCEGIDYNGCVDESGVVELATGESESEDGCTVHVDARVIANLTESPTGGTLAVNVSGSGITCPLFDDCSAIVDATVTNQEGTDPPPGVQAGLTSEMVRKLLGR